MLTSCSEGETDLTPVEKPSYTLRIRLNPDADLTRAGSWGDINPDDENEWDDNSPVVDGTFDESYIRTLKLFYVENGGNLIPLKFEKQVGNTYICTLTSETGLTFGKDNSVTFSGKIMVLANIGGIAPADKWVENSDGRVLASWLKKNIPFTMTYPHYIPMWGIQTFSGIQLVKDGITDIIENIDLLRAESKIIVKLDDSLTDDYYISSVTLKSDSPKFQKSGFMLPKGAFLWSGDETCTPVNATTELDRENCFNVRTSPQPSFEPVFSAVSPSQNEYISYVAESQTKTDEPYMFEVTLSSKNHNSATQNRDITGILYFSKYDITGNMVDPGTTIEQVVRNHIYEFTINLKELLLAPTVREWEWVATLHNNVTETYPATPTAQFNNKTLTLTCRDSGASIKYSKDEGATWLDYPATGITDLTKNCTVVFYAYINDNGKTFVSNKGSYEFDISEHRVATPKFVCSVGETAATKILTITCDTQGAKIRYTQSTPTEPVTNPTSTSGTEYTGPITFGHNTTVKAVAYTTDGSLYDSEIATYVISSFEIQEIDRPTYVFTKQKLYLYVPATHEASIIRYRKYKADADPSNLWSTYEGVPFSLNREDDGCIIQFFAKATDYGYGTSSTEIFVFKYSDHQVKQPVISYNKETQSITITSDTASARISYNIMYIDSTGNEVQGPTGIYSSSLTLSSNYKGCKVKASATDKDGNLFDSEETVLTVTFSTE